MNHTLKVALVQGLQFWLVFETGTIAGIRNLQHETKVEVSAALQYHLAQKTLASAQIKHQLLV